MNATGGNKAQKPCRVAVASKGDSIESAVGSIGTSAYFIIFEGGPDRYSAVKNVAKGRGGNAGMQAAEFLETKGIDVIIAGTMGNKGYRAFDEAGVAVHAGCSGTVKECIRKCLSGELPKCNGAAYSGNMEL